MSAPPSLDRDHQQSLTRLRAAVRRGATADAVIEVSFLHAVKDARAAKAITDYLNTIGRDGYTAIQWAAENGNVAVVEGLLSIGADPTVVDSTGWTALHWAIDQGHADAAETLIPHMKDSLNTVTKDGHCALSLVAASTCDVRVVPSLVKAGADVNVRLDNNDTPLHWAARTNNVDAARSLLGEGADIKAIDSDGCTALHVACVDGNTAVACTLLEKEFNGRHVVSFRNHEQQTPLLAAVAHERVETVNALLDAASRYIDLDECHGQVGSCVHTAVVANCPEMVSLLLEVGASPDVENTVGDTPLHTAAALGYDDVVSALLSGPTHPDLDHRNKTSQPALVLAKTAGVRKLINDAMKGKWPEKGTGGGQGKGRLKRRRSESTDGTDREGSGGVEVVGEQPLAKRSKTDGKAGSSGSGRSVSELTLPQKKKSATTAISVGSVQIVSASGPASGKGTGNSSSAGGRRANGRSVSAGGTGGDRGGPASGGRGGGASVASTAGRGTGRSTGRANGNGSAVTGSRKAADARRGAGAQKANGGRWRGRRGASAVGSDSKTAELSLVDVLLLFREEQREALDRIERVEKAQAEILTQLKTIRKATAKR